MRKLIYAFGLTSALVFALAAHAAAPNFAGAWTLDKSKSQGLNQRWQNADSVTMNITQTDKDITVEEKVTGGGGPGGPGGAPPSGAPAAGAPQGGGPGGGGPGRGMGMGGPRTSISMAVRLAARWGRRSSCARRCCRATARLWS